MVDAKLHLEAVSRLGEGTHHDPGVVDENINLLLLWEKKCSMFYFHESIHLSKTILPSHL